MSFVYFPKFYFVARFFSKVPSQNKVTPMKATLIMSGGLIIYLEDDL